MQVLDKEVLSQLVGGLEGIDHRPVPVGDGGGDGGGGFGGGGGGGGAGGGGGFPDVRGYAYDLAAVGVEGGQQAVVKISGAIPVFDNPPPRTSVGQEPAAWEGSLVGMYTEPSLSVEHIAFDALLTGAVYNEASNFGEAALRKMFKVSGHAPLPGPLKLGAIAIGAGTAYASILLLERKGHPKHGEGDNRTFIDKDGVRHMPRAMDSDDDDTTFTGPAGGSVMRMAF